MRKTWLLGLGLFLAACSFTVTIDLPDQTLELPGAVDTGGKVVYKANPLGFTPPSVDVIKGIKVEGILKASEPLSLTMEFYARTQDPRNDSACISVASVYLCTPGSNDEKVGEVAFENSQTTNLTLQGSKLLEGVKNGKLWLGISAKGLPANSTLEFKNMKAYVTVGL